MNSFKDKLIKVLKMSFAISIMGFLMTNSSIEASDKHFPQGPCASEVKSLIRNDRVYKKLFKTLRPHIRRLTELTHNTVDQTSYNFLLAEARLIASRLSTGRVVVVDPDGLVVVDTSKPDTTNSFANFKAGADPLTFSSAINVNHNSRIAILDAQLQICGAGAETKFSNTLGVAQNYVAIRLGNFAEGLTTAKSYLNNDGTARISVNVGANP